MTLTYISCSSDFYTFYVNAPLSLGCMIRKVSAEDIAIRGNGTGLEYMCPTRHFVYIFFNPVFQVSTAKNEINLFNNHVQIVAPVTFAPAGAMTPSAEFLLTELLISKSNQTQRSMYFLMLWVLIRSALSIFSRPFLMGSYFSHVNILSLPLIQEGQLSVSGERVCTSTG